MIDTSVRVITVNVHQVKAPEQERTSEAADMAVGGGPEVDH